MVSHEDPMTTAEKIATALKLLKEARRAVDQMKSPLPQDVVDQIVSLQGHVVELRNSAVTLHRESGYSLKEIAHAYDLSPSRVSQLANHIKLPQSKRIRRSHREF